MCATSPISPEIAVRQVESSSFRLCVRGSRFCHMTTGRSPTRGTCKRAGDHSAAEGSCSSISMCRQLVVIWISWPSCFALNVHLTILPKPCHGRRCIEHVEQHHDRASPYQCFRLFSSMHTYTHTHTRQKSRSDGVLCRRGRRCLIKVCRQAALRMCF